MELLYNFNSFPSTKPPLLATGGERNMIKRDGRVSLPCDLHSSVGNVSFPCESWHFTKFLPQTLKCLGPAHIWSPSTLDTQPRGHRCLHHGGCCGTRVSTAGSHLEAEESGNIGRQTLARAALIPDSWQLIVHPQKSSHIKKSIPLLQLPQHGCFANGNG